MGAFEVGQLAEQLVGHYTSMLAGWVLLQHPASEFALRALEQENRGPAAVPSATIERHDGSSIYYDVLHWLRSARDDPGFRSLHSRLGLETAVITIANAVEEEGGFDRAPDLEFLRHLRNGVAHGNRFEIRGREPTRPAYFDNMSDAPTRFEITAAVNGLPVLFDFLGPGDVSDLLTKIAVRLTRVGKGDPPLAPFTSP